MAADSPHPLSIRTMLLDATVLDAGDGSLTLNHAYSVLDAARIQELSEGCAQVSVLPICGSTQDEALAGLRTDPTITQAVFAEAQHSGRGRHGRQFVIAPLCSLAFSVARRLPIAVARLAGLSAAMGVAVAEVLAEHKGVRLKWPNDLLLDGAKLGGMLVEVSGGKDHSDICLGVGINLLPSTSLLRVDRTTISLFRQAAGCPSRNRIAAQLLVAIDRALTEFVARGLSPFMARYRGLDALFGHPVEVLSGDQKMCGIAHGLGDDGSLLVDDGVGIQRVLSGEAMALAPTMRVRLL